MTIAFTIVIVIHSHCYGNFAGLYHLFDYGPCLFVPSVQKGLALKLEGSFVFSTFVKSTIDQWSFGMVI